jgi:hypothetical protein
MRFNEIYSYVSVLVGKQRNEIHFLIFMYPVVGREYK